MDIVAVIGYLFVLLVSLSVLGISAKFTVEKAVRLSYFFGISKFAIGFIFIAVMTSIPELSVAVTSSTAGQGNLSLGDVLGSNVTNLSLILGLCVLFGLRALKDKIPFVIFLLPLISLILLFDGTLTYIDGILLFILFGIFVYFVFRENLIISVKRPTISKAEAAKDFVIFIISIATVLIAAGFVVESAISVAKEVGIFVGFIGATAIALGTSLPELAVDITAVRRGRGSLALGDLVGSCVVNLTLILGTNATINPFEPNLIITIPIVVFVVLTTLVAAYATHKKGFTKTDGMMMLAIYAIYLALLSGIQIVSI